MLTDDDRKQERREEQDIVCILWFILKEKPQRQARIETVSAKKSQGSTRDSNPACSNRNMLLYRLNYHRGP